MRKLLVLLSFAALAMIGTTSCNLQLAPYAAIVDGTTISQQQLNQALQKVAADPGYICSALAGASVPVRGTGSGTYDSRFTSLVLSTLIRAQLAAAAVRREHVEVTPFLTAILQPELTTQFGPNTQTGCTESGAKVLDALGPSLQKSVEQLGDDLYALQAHANGVSLTVAGVEAYESAHPAESRSSCISLIEVKTASLAATIRKDLQKGSSFASLAKRFSIGETASQGGTLGCAGELVLSSPGVLPPQILKGIPATVGAISAVTSYEGDFYLFALTSSTQETPQQLAVDLISSDQRPITAILTRLDATASVQLDPAYGSWGGANAPGGVPIVAPSSPPAKFLPNPGAASAPTPTTVAPAAPPSGG